MVVETEYFVVGRAHLTELGQRILQTPSERDSLPKQQRVVDEVCLGALAIHVDLGQFVVDDLDRHALSQLARIHQLLQRRLHVRLDEQRVP